MGPGPRVHLAVLGRNDSVVRRLVSSAHAGSAVLHPSFARIFEVCRFDGVAYAVADPSEGLDVSAVLSAGPFPFELALAVTSIIGRVAVAVHDAAGGRGQVGFASVVSGGLSPDVVFLEPTGAVRIRPVAAAGLDPEEPTAFRAPEEAITMAADVYSLGRLLIAMLSGDPRGLTMPRLSPSSPLPPLIARMVTRRPHERPHLHEAVTRIEQVLNGRQAGSADQVVRNALGGPFRQLVVDPGLGLEAPPHVMHELRMRLPYVYAATERIWPTMNPGFMPAPAVFAALPVQSQQALLGTGDDNDDADVFSEPPAPRKRQRTATTMRIDARELAAAVAVVDANGAHQPVPTRRFRPTQKTVLIATGEMVDEIDRQAPGADATAMLDASELEPFAADVVPAQSAPVPRAHDIDDGDDDDAFNSSFSPPPARSAVPPPRPSSVPPIRPPRPGTHAAMAVFGNRGEDPAGDDDDDEPLFAPNKPPANTSALTEVAIERVATPRSSLAEADRAALLAALAHENVAIDGHDDDEDAFSSTSISTSGSLSTLVAPSPAASDPDLHTVQRPSANALSLEVEEAAQSPVGTPSSPVIDEMDGEVDFAAAFAAAFSAEPSATHAQSTIRDADEGPVVLDLEEIDEIEPLDDAAIERLDDGAAFVMVGEAGALFPPDGPLSRSTRMYPAQAMQVAVDDDSSSIADSPVDDSSVDDSPVDDSPVDDSSIDDSAVNDSAADDSAAEHGAADDSAVDDSAVDDSAVDDSAVDDRVERRSVDSSSDNGFAPSQRPLEPRGLDLDVNAAFDSATATASPWAPPSSATGPGVVDSPRTELVDAVNWQSWSNESSAGATRPMMPAFPDVPRIPTPSSPSSRAFAATMPAIPAMPVMPAPTPAPLTPPQPVASLSLPAPPPTLSVPPAALPPPPPPLPAPPPTLSAPPRSAMPAPSMPAPSMPPVSSGLARSAPASQREFPSARRAPPPVGSALASSSSARRGTLPPMPVALPESPSRATMVSPLPELPSQAPATTVGSDVFEPSVPRSVTGSYSATPPVVGSAELVVEAPAGATVALNGTPIGTVPDAGRLSVDVAGDARVVVRVTLAGRAPWSSVVSVLGRPRVRVKAVLAARP